MTLQLAHTRIAIQFIVEDDTGQVERFLTAATTVLMVAVKVIELTADVIQAVDFGLKVATIGFKSMAFGLGVPI